MAYLDAIEPPEWCYNHFDFNHRKETCMLPFSLSHEQIETILNVSPAILHHVSSFNNGHLSTDEIPFNPFYILPPNSETPYNNCQISLHNNDGWYHVVFRFGGSNAAYMFHEVIASILEYNIRCLDCERLLDMNGENYQNFKQTCGKSPV